MRKRRYTENQIIRILNEVENSHLVNEVKILAGTPALIHQGNAAIQDSGNV